MTAEPKDGGKPSLRLLDLARQQDALRWHIDDEPTFSVRGPAQELELGDLIQQCIDYSAAVARTPAERVGVRFPEIRVGLVVNYPAVLNHVMIRCMVKHMQQVRRMPCALSLSVDDLGECVRISVRPSEPAGGPRGRTVSLLRMHQRLRATYGGEAGSSRYFWRLGDELLQHGAGYLVPTETDLGINATTLFLLKDVARQSVVSALPRDTRLQPPSGRYECWNPSCPRYAAYGALLPSSGVVRDATSGRVVCTLCASEATRVSHSNRGFRSAVAGSGGATFGVLVAGPWGFLLGAAAGVLLDLLVRSHDKDG